MAEKISTIILKVDLKCRSCYKKISKAICKLQERENIQAIAFDEKNDTVTISGPFDPHKMCKKLCLKACNVIEDIQIKDNKEKPKDTKPAEPAKDKPKDAKPAEPAKDKPKDAKPAEAAKDKPKDAKPAEAAKDKPKDAGKDAKPAEPAKDKPKDTKPAEPEKDKPKALEPSPPAPSEPGFFLVEEPRYGYQPVWAGPGYGGGPGYEGYYRGYSWAPAGPLGPPMVAYGAPVHGAPVYGAPVYDGYRNGQFFCEEDPQSSCSIM